VERRAFPRQPIDHLTVLRLPDGTAIAARVVEASQRGARVEVDRELPEGTHVRLTLKEQIVLGHVCYCLVAADREFILGVHLDDPLTGIDDLTNLNQALTASASPKLQADGVDGVVERPKETLPETLR